MKYRLTFYCPNEVRLPMQYNHIMQAALLNWLGEPDYTEFLHDTGYQLGDRRLKLYTFSNLQGRYKVYPDIKKIGFSGELSFYCSFYEEQGDVLIRRNEEREKPFRLGENRLAFLKCERIKEEYTCCVVDTVSPITVHSTVELPNGKKRTYYYEPQERDFSDMIRQNLLRKYQAYHGYNINDDEFYINCISGESYKPASIYYQRFVIKGWRGRFLLRGSKELIKMALLCGVGSRNGIGCGCIVQKGTVDIV